MLAVIGSVALLEQNIDLGRKPSDVDLVGDYDELVRFLKDMQAKGIMPIAEGKKIVGRTQHTVYECEIAWSNSSSEELLKLIRDDPKSYVVDNQYYASLDICYLLKMTHRFKKNSPHFLKTMQDIHKLRELGATIRPEHQDFYKRRLAETLDYKHPKLNQGKKDFFTDDVPYVYDHDTIHEAIKLYRKPAYSYFKPDESEVLTSRKLFRKLPLALQLASVYEESCVLALERSQIPHPQTDRHKSFTMALEKVCTSITSGWFREFAWEHYDEVLSLYMDCIQLGYPYWECFKYGLENGIIKPHERN